MSSKYFLAKTKNQKHGHVENHSETSPIEETVPEAITEEVDTNSEGQIDTEPAPKQSKSNWEVAEKSAYCDRVKRKIRSKKEMMKMYPEASHLVVEKHDIGMEDGNQKLLNELVYIENLSVEEQEKLFDKYQSYNNDTLIESYKFCEIRRKYSVFLCAKLHTLYCANLYGDIKQTLTIRN